MAQALRKAANSAQPGDGRMVGRTFVAPHWTEQLAPLLQQFQAGQAERASTKANADYQGRLGQAKQDWMSSLPQTIAAIPGRAELPGPVDEGGSPELAAVARTPAVLPTRDAVLKATMAGLRIPGNESAANLFNKGMSDDLTREDTQVFRTEERTANNQFRKDSRDADILARADEKALGQKAASDNLKATLEQRAADAKMRSEDMRLSIQQRADAAKDAVAARREIASGMQAIAQGKTSEEKPAKPLPANVMKPMTELENATQAITATAAAYKPEFGGLGGAMSKIAGTYVPGVSTEAANFWKDYAKQTQLPERHASFGATLPKGELSAWRDADIFPGMAPKLIQENLAKRAAIAQRAFERSREKYEAAGYPSVKDAFPSLRTPSAAPAPRAPPAGVIGEGSIKENAKTGQRVILRNNQWVPL